MKKLIKIIGILLLIAACPQIGLEELAQKS